MIDYTSSLKEAIERIRATLKRDLEIIETLMLDMQNKLDEYFISTHQEVD